MTYHEIGGLRARLGMSRHDLSRLLGVSVHKIVRWERDKAPPTEAELLLLKHVHDTAVTPLRTPQELFEARKTLGLTQVELAARLGVHPITVSRWENGARGYKRNHGLLIALMLKEKARDSVAG
jgi:DNA-binding transcriptional regulator YiaG